MNGRGSIDNLDGAAIVSGHPDDKNGGPMTVYPVTENFAAEIADVSNLDASEAIWGEKSRKRMFEMGNRMWHTDSSFRRLPAKASLLYAQHSAGRWPDRVRRHASRLRRPRG